MYRVGDNIKAISSNYVLLTGYVLMGNNSLQQSRQTDEPFLVFKIAVFRKVPQSKLGTNMIPLDIFECIAFGDVAKDFNINHHEGSLVTIRGNIRVQPFKLKDGTQSMHYVIYCSDVDFIGRASAKLLKYFRENKDIRQLKFTMRDDAYTYYRNALEVVTVALDEEKAYLLM